MVTVYGLGIIKAWGWPLNTSHRLRWNGRNAFFGHFLLKSLAEDVFTSKIKISQKGSVISFLNLRTVLRRWGQYKCTEFFFFNVFSIFNRSRLRAYATHYLTMMFWITVLIYYFLLLEVEKRCPNFLLIKTPIQLKMTQRRW